MGTASHHGLDRRGARHGAARHARRFPAVHADRLRAAEASGRRAVELATNADPADRRSSREKSVENALRVLLAIGGSTNAIVHLTAIAGRAGIDVST